MKGEKFCAPRALETLHLALSSSDRLMPKAGTQLTFAQGANVFWNNSAKTCKATSAGYYCIGAAVAAAGANDTHVIVRLDGRATTAV
jgi:Uncharacterized conserved protein (DUF2190)